MAIAGVKPFKINYLDDDVFIENAWDKPEAEIHSGFPETFVGYTETQVRNILIKFGKEYEIDGPAYGMGETLEDFVDEFMKNGRLEK